MGLLRDYKWLWVIIGIIVVSLMISYVFYLINKCITKQAEAETRSARSYNAPEFYAPSNKYHPKSIEDDLPPLPPRTQFLTAETQSYENLADLPDYVKVEAEVILPPPPPPYQYPEPAAAVVQQAPSGLRSTCSLASASTEDYDDIGEDDDGANEEDEEDYDDVG